MPDDRDAGYRHVSDPGLRDLAGEQEPGRGAGGRGTGERDQAGEQVITQGVN